MLDLDAYLARIGLSGRPSLREVHRAHATSIPFENLDPHRGVPVSLDPEDLERKLVTQRRGGYCFEHNLLLKSALECLGAHVEMLLARVRVGAAPGEVPGRSHLLLRVHTETGVWHADVGFGAGGQLDPLPFGPGVEHDQSGWRFRVIEDAHELVLQTIRGGHWSDLYGFVPEPVPQIDVQMSNWFTATYPRSRFVAGLSVSRYRGDGTRTALSDRSALALIRETPVDRRVTPVDPADVPTLLANEFGLPGFTLDGDGRVVLGTHGPPGDRARAASPSPG